ncbi:MAG: hypothetical protein NUV51_03135 [Sulfuricaulis sp.]|nr:hypothetical protein [Sulfuricaulis sp.]
MTARSIFQKICPGCMITLPLDARVCSCGHQFDHDETDISLSSEEIRVKAEELYESYLAARVEQANNSVMSAQAEFARDPANSQKSQLVADAIRESEKARAALSEQSVRVRELKKALPAVSPPSRTLPAPTAPIRLLAQVKPAPAPTRTRAMAKAVLAVASISKSVSVHSSQITQKVIPAQAEKKPMPSPVPVHLKDSLPPVLSRAPNKIFRQTQAAKAEKILRAVKNVKTSAPEAIEKFPPKPKTRSEILLTASVLTNAAPRLLTPDRKECPNCTSNVDQQLNRCRCGYEFPTSELLIPALNMSEEERAEFAKIFGFP